MGNVAGAVVVEIFNPPIPGAVAVLDDGDLLMKRIAHRHILEALSVGKPLSIGGVLVGDDFFEVAGLVRHDLRQLLHHDPVALNVV